MENTVPRLKNIAEYLDCFASELEAAGWFVTHDEVSLAVKGYFKNGNPKRGPSIQLMFYDRTAEDEFNIENDEFASRKLTGREKPWRVDSWRFKQGKCFKHIHSAMELFIEEVRASNPIESKGLWAGH